MDPRLPPQELVRLAFPELTRCEYCNKLDSATQQYDRLGEKRWLHRDCWQFFKPPECYPVLYRKRGLYQAEDDLHDEEEEEEDGEEEGEEEASRRRKPKWERRPVGAVVLIDDVWHGYRHNSSGRLKVRHESENREDVIDAFHQPWPDPPEGPITRRIYSKKWVTVDSVQWCGGLQKCACYDDGEITAHKFRWEEIEIIKRKVKV